MELIQKTNLKKIYQPNGDILHALKSTDDGFKRFGEVYFSKINHGSIKAWKRHLKMTLNLVCPIGKVKFVFYKEKLGFETAIIGEEIYQRLTVPPGIWFGFQGMSSPFSLVMNLADIVHDPKEIERLSIECISFPMEKVS